MKNSIIYISLIIALLGLCSCSMEEQYAPVSNESTIQLVPRITSFNGVDVATKADGDAPAFETAIYTAYLLIFDNKGSRVHFSSVAEDNGSWSQKVTMKNLPSGTACFIANVFQSDVEGIDTIEELNDAVLNLSYATYDEAGGYLGVPKLAVNGESKLCIPLFGSASLSAMTHNQTYRIDVKRLFAKVSVNLKMNLTNIGIGQIAPTTVNYELDQYLLYNLPTKVSLVPHADGDESESEWVKDNSSFTGSETVPVSSANNLGWQTININDSDTNTDNNSTSVTGIDFCFYVPEYYLASVSNPIQDQKSKPNNVANDKHAIYLKLVGKVNQSLIDNTNIRHKIYLGGNHIDNFTLKRNLNYNNQITIKGIENNDKGTGDNLDHRVSTDIINNPVAQAGKSANCYIIAKPGEYTIPAYKGAYNNLNGATLCMAGKDLSEYETRVEVLANVVEYESITSITFANSPTYDPETNTISFTVNPMLNNDNWVPNGSVIMALQYRKNGETQWTTEWSWHLWFVYNITASEDGWGTIGYQTMPDGTTYMMDRNLGVHANELAIPGSKVGFYYKYGQHTPYLDPDGDGTYAQYGGGSISDATPVWSSSKSVTDPCPPGYRMPSKSVWTDRDVYNNTVTNSLLYTTEISYPYSGFISSNNTKQGDEASNGQEPSPLSNVKIPKNQDRSLSIYSKPDYNPIVCSSIKYKTVDLNKAGYLLTYSNANENLLKYYYQEEGIELLECKYIQGSWTQKGITRYWVASYTNEQKNNTITKTGTVLKAEDPTLYDAIMSGIKDETSGFLGSIWDSITGYFNFNADLQWTTVNNDYAYQVRCVKE